jgi:hypothetical protein
LSDDCLSNIQSVEEGLSVVDASLPNQGLLSRDKGKGGHKLTI